MTDGERRQAELQEKIDELATRYEAEGMVWWRARGRATDEVLSEGCEPEDGS